MDNYANKVAKEAYFSAVLIAGLVLKIIRLW